MTCRRLTWPRIAGLTVIVCLGGAALGRAQFTSFNDRSRAGLEGNWQSCRGDDGQYSERVYDGRWPGMTPFELHLGPYHEFALFRGIQDDHREHDSSANLLSPHTVEVVGSQARYTWDVAGLHFDVRLAGGSRDECESWYVTLTPVRTASH
jgi:hypothetical protein